MIKVPDGHSTGDFLFLYPFLFGDLEGESFEVFGFGDDRDNGMIRGLTVDLSPAQDLVSIEGRVQDDVLEGLCVHMVRTAEGGQCAAGPQELQGSQVDLFVSIQRGIHRVTVPGERGGIQNDEVKEVFLFYLGILGVFDQPVEGVGVDKGAAGKAVEPGTVNGCVDRRFALVDANDFTGSGFGGMQREAAQEAEAVQDTGSGGHIAYFLVVDLLIQIAAGLVAGIKVDLELELVQSDKLVARGCGAVQGGMDHLHAFKGTGRGIVLLQDGGRMKDLFEGFHNQGLALIHAQRGGLKYEDIFILVNDQSAEEIAFGVHDPEGGGTRHGMAAHFQGGFDPVFEKLGVEGQLFPSGEESDPDLRLGVEKPASNEVVSGVQDLHTFPIGDGFTKRGYFTIIDPRMPGA